MGTAGLHHELHSQCRVHCRADTTRAVNLSLSLTFLSLVFWAFVIGPLGAVLAIPLTLLAKALLLDVDPSTRWISSLLVGGMIPPEEADADETPESEPDASTNHADVR